MAGHYLENNTWVGNRISRLYLMFYSIGQLYLNVLLHESTLYNVLSHGLTFSI